MRQPYFLRTIDGTWDYCIQSGHKKTMLKISVLLCKYKNRRIHHNNC